MGHISDISCGSTSSRFRKEEEIIMRAILDDVEWTVPNQYESGVYKWTIHINIFPIPFVSGVVAALVAQMSADETKLNQSLQSQGVSGTATLIDKNVTLKKEWWGTAVSKVTIDYTVAFTPTQLGTTIALNHRAMLFAWAALIPFIPLIKATLIALVAIILIVKVQSVIYRIFGPKEYTPYQAGDCAKGWVYDASKGVCVKTGEIMNILLLGGLVIAVFLARGGTKVVVAKGD